VLVLPSKPSSTAPSCWCATLAVLMVPAQTDAAALHAGSMEALPEGVRNKELVPKFASSIEALRLVRTISQVFRDPAGALVHTLDAGEHYGLRPPVKHCTPSQTLMGCASERNSSS
jgi:hypothetical protein